MPQFDTRFYFSQIFWMCISFGILVWIIHRWIMPKLVYVQEQRQQKIEISLNHAKTIQKKAAQLDEQAQQALNQAQMDSKKIVQDALKVSQERLTHLVQSHKESYAKQLESLQNTIELERAQSWAMLQSSIPELSQSLVARWSHGAPSKLEETP
jgi:F-type H+-transporting ATPase subunit b